MNLSFRYKNDENTEELSLDECDKRPLTAEETIACVIDRCMYSLEEMCDCERNGKALSDYAKGTKCAYAEILEILQKWEKKDAYGLGFDIEKEFFGQSGD